MKIRTQLFLLGLALPVVLVAQVNQPSRSAPIVFTHVTVIDATGAPAQQDMTVVISGNRITEIGKEDQRAEGSKSSGCDGQVHDSWPLGHAHPHTPLRRKRTFAGQWCYRCAFDERRARVP